MTAALATVLATVVACGDDGGEGTVAPEQRSAIVERLQATESLAPEEAECVVDDAGEELGGDRLQAVVDLYTGGTPDAQADDVAAAEEDLEVVYEAFESCGLGIELEE